MKKIISVILLFSLLVTLAPLAFSVPAAADGASDKVIEITDAAGLKKLSGNLSAKAVLMNDIEISGSSWTPIGTIDKPFSGEFDGNGHTVTYKLKFSKGSEKGVLASLFGCVSGSVKRLNAAGTLSAEVDTGYIAAVAGVLKDGGTLFNCCSSVDITAKCKSASAIGGIAGCVYSTIPEKDGVLILCENKGSITAGVTTNAAGDSSPLSNGTTGALGGILGFIADSACAEINKCINGGSIEVDGGQYNIGGIAGQTSTNGSASTAVITECANKGDITVKNLKGERAAGIIGYIKSGNIDHCYNTGNIAAYSDGGKKVSKNGYGTYFGIFGYANLGSGNTLSCTFCYSASEEPLEAEICVVRNPSYGTFQNYYTEGREEYETKLNSNATAGKKGTAFKDAADLTSKITAKSSKYKADENGGYPVLYWETPSVLSTDGSIELYGCVREREEDFDFRIVVLSKTGLSGAKLDIEFKSKDGKSVKTESFSIGDSAKECVSVYSENAEYIPQSGSVLYSAVIEGQALESWSRAEIKILKEGKEIISKTAEYKNFMKETTPSKINLGDLPEYPDGKASAKYNAGPGLENDQNRTTPTDSYMIAVSGTKAESFDNYIETLGNSGFTCEFSNTIEDNRYYQFAKDGKQYYIYYTAKAKEARFILDNSSTKLVKEICTGRENTGKVEMYQYALDFTKGTGQTSGRDFWEIDCGMFYIIRLADNSLFLIDGGHMRQSSDSALEAINDFLHEITNIPDGEKVKIAGWFFSHAHGDHVYLTHAFLEKYHDQYDLECVYGNIPSYQTMPGGYDGGTFLMKDTVNKYYPGCDCVKLHTGETFELGGVGFEVLFSHEDAVNASTGKTMISDFNASSTVIRMNINGKSVMFLGDVSGVSENVMCGSFGKTTLHSDAVQLSHHCFNDLPTLYNAICAPLLLCPNSVENANGNDQKRQNAINAAGKDYRGILYAGLVTYKLTFEGDKIEYTEDRPIYTDGFYANFRTELGKYEGTDQSENPLDVSVLDGLTDRSSLIYDKSGKGTSGTKADEAPQTLFDGQTSTKWCVTDSKSAYVMWKTKEAIGVKAYQLFAGNDTATHTGRNPKCWTLWGSVDGVEWVRLDSVYDGNMNTANFSASTYKTDNDGEYGYFTLYIHSTADSGTTMQISEIKLFG